MKCELNGQLIRVKLKHRMKLIRVNMYEVQSWFIANFIFRIAKIETPLKIRNSLDYSFLTIIETSRSFFAIHDFMFPIVSKKRIIPVNPGWPNRSVFTDLVHIGPYLVRICSASPYSYGPGRNLLY